MNIMIVTVFNDEGDEVFAGLTRHHCDIQLAEYCRENWNRGRHGRMPDADPDVSGQYFEAEDHAIQQGGHGDTHEDGRLHVAGAEDLILLLQTAPSEIAEGILENLK